ncbi:MAG: heme o synthase [Betaproteobacteria bacterium]|nr:heme o synthase [Betaproteobacteria bacterium]
MAFRDYLSITKPGIVLGNLVSVAGGFFLASRGRIDWLLLLATGLGIALVIGSGCVFNNCIDRDIDCKMRRTRNRALVRGRVSLGSALAIGLGLGLGGSLLLYTLTNLLTVAVVLSGFGIYVGVYSLYMKRHSRYGTLVGSLAGAVPPLAGYCAVTNHFDLGAVMLLLMFSLWQLPHAYAIAILHLQDYTAAEIPVLPVAKGVPFAKKHMAGYVAAFMVASLLPALGRYTGLGYLAVALALGGYWLYVAWDGRNAVDDRLWARKLFLFSIVMIMALSLMMSVDFKLYPGLQPFTRV